MLYSGVGGSMTDLTAFLTRGNGRPSAATLAAPTPQVHDSVAPGTTPTLYKYRATAVEDLLIARWWAHMCSDGDIERVFTKGAQTLGALLRIVAPPKAMFYTMDETGITFAAWFDQLFNSLVAGMWIRSDCRKSRGILEAWLQSLDFAFTAVPTVLGITKQPSILEGHEKIGYKILDKIPEMWDGEDAWLLMLTREAFAKASARYRRTRTKGLGSWKAMRNNDTSTSEDAHGRR